VWGRAMRNQMEAAGAQPTKPREQRESVVIRFAGDSGDGMQLTGMQFTTESTLAGNDIGTLPDFAVEIRAPARTLAGVSGFQINFSNYDVCTFQAEDEIAGVCSAVGASFGGSLGSPPAAGRGSP